MSFLFHKPKTPAQTPPTKLANIHITEAVIGKTLPILMGQRRVSQSLIYYADFTAVPHVQQTSSGGGGKGLGGGGGSTQTTTTYTYTAATMGALCSGPVSGIVNVWDTKGRFQQTTATESFTIPGGGGAYTVVNHGLFKLDRGVGFAQSYSQTVNDFGSPGPTTLSGSFQVPMTGQPGTVAPGPGQYAYDASTGTYHFHSADTGKAVSITYSYNLLNLNNVEDTTIPGTPFQVLVNDSADFLQDNGVVFYPSGTALTKVASSPSAGQYTVTAGGLYTFAAADANKQIQISYVTHTTNQQSDAQTSLNITLLPGTQGQGVWSYLTSRHPEATIGYTETAIVASAAMDLGSNGEMPNYSFEVSGPYQYGSGIADCDPADCIGALLSDPFFGNGFPTSAFGDWTQASNFWVANSFFISPLIDSQTSIASQIGAILEAGMTAGFWSEGQLKLVPYGDTSAAGNGQIFVPNTQPIVDLTDDDFIGDGLVKVTRTAWQDANNKVQVTWSNRLNGYNNEVTTEQDDAAIQRYGLRMEDPQSWDFITTLAAAQFAANLRVKRSVNVRAQYTFSITSNYSYLEPMDLVTITVPELGWTKLPVRIQKIVDHPDDNGLEITAEEFPWGTAQPTLYAKQTGVGFKPNAGQADPGNTTALIFEAPNRLALQQGNLLYIFCSGQSPDWGGCDVYVSFDGVNYQFQGQVTNPARLGTLTTNWAPATNLITNGDGETGTVGSQATGWTLGGGNNLVVATDQFRFGSRSLKIDNSITPADSFSYQDISVTSGVTYQLSGWIKTTALPSADAGTGATLNVDTGTGVTGFTILSKNGADFPAYFGQPPQPDVGIFADDTAHDWTFVSSIFQPIGTGTIRLYCQLGFGAAQSGIAWFDNVAISPIAADPDTSNFQVTMATAGSTLPNISTTDFDSKSAVLCALVDPTHNAPFELFAYKNSNLVAANTYQLDTFHRGLMGTTVAPHMAGETFARLDQASFTYQYDPSYYGKTITFKFPSFNTVGGRPQPLSQASAFSFTLPGAGAGAIDLNTGIYRPGRGAVQNIAFPAFSITRNTTSLTVSWSGTLTRGSVPNPSQPNFMLDQAVLAGSVTISGLTAGTNYWLYPYVDDLTGNPTLQFVNSSIAAGATGTSSFGAIAFTSTNVTAASFQQRNDHLSLGTIATSTTSSGSSSGSGGGSGGTCPRHDMVVLHRDKGVVPVGSLVPGDYIWGRDKGVDHWILVRDTNRKTRRDWVDMDFDCDEGVVVTPNHGWPTDRGIIPSSEITPEHVFYQTEGRTFLNGWRKLRDEAECIGIELASEDHAYYIGRRAPKLLTQNGFVLPS